MSKQNERINKARAANPPITVEPTAEGYILNESDPAKPKQSVGFLGYLFGGIFLLAFIGLVPLIAFIAFISVLFYRPLRQWILAYFFLWPGELVFTHYPLRLGSDSRVTFRRKLKGNRKFLPDSAIAIKLLCIERVSYTKGTDTIVETAVVEEEALRSQSILSGDNEAICHFDLSIPAHLPASFEAGNNQIRWIAVIEQTMPGIVDRTDSNFTFFVEP